ncbi:MAG: AEC family transporter [Lachnospiraceae bacterium]|nr:AEC family transporter [Lachnospiraceae bacterium]
MSVDVMNSIIMLFGLIAVGYISNTAGVLDETANSRFSTFLLKVSLPATILDSAISQEAVEQAAVIRLIFTAVGVFILVPFFSKIIVSRFHLDAACELMLNYSNLGFMGFPIIASVYGEEYVFYAAVFLMVFNVHLFTVGVMTLQGGLGDEKREGEKPHFWKTLCSPGIAAALLAFVIVIVKVPIPDFAGKIAASLGAVTTPLAMVVIGSQLAQVEILQSLKNPKLYLIALFKLIIYPSAVYLILLMIMGNGMIPKIAAVLTGLPVAGNVTMLCQEYGGDVALAAQGTCVTALLSLLTVPVMLSIL